MVAVWSVINCFDAAVVIEVVWSVEYFDAAAEKAEAGVLVKAVLAFAVCSDAVGLLVGWVALVVVFAAAVAVVVVVAAEFGVVRVELQAEVMVEMGVAKKVVADDEIDFAGVVAVAGVVVYVGSVAGVVVAVVGLLESCVVAVVVMLESCIAAAVEGLAQAAVMAEIEVAAKGVGIGVDAVVSSERHIVAAVAGVDLTAAMAVAQLVEKDAIRIGVDVAE